MCRELKSKFIRLISNRNFLLQTVSANKIFSYVQLGFGKSMPTATVWLDCLHETVNVEVLGYVFSGYGTVHFIFIDKIKKQALVFYEDVETSKCAVNDIRGEPLNGSRVQVYLITFLFN